jgi:hypothetical protein
MSSVKTFMTKKLHQMKSILIHEPKRLAGLLVVLTALLQLALSQYHIEALVTVKLTVSTIGASNYTSGMPSIGIGMFNFLFILSGLATTFNITRAVTEKRKWIAIISIILTIIFGLIFTLKMTNPDNIQDYGTVERSVNFMIFGMISYGIVIALMIYDILRKK